MRISEWKHAVWPALPETENWDFRESMCYRLPVERVLIGILGEGSGFDKGAYIWRVSMPLFVPSDIVDLSWSERVGGRAHKFYKLDEEEIGRAIRQAFEGLEDEEMSLHRMATRETESSRNRRVHEVVGYAQLLLGDVAAARASLSRAASVGVRSTAEQGVIDRVHHIIGLLDEEGIERAVDQLDQWCTATADALGLRRSAASDQRAGHRCRFAPS